MSGSQTEKLLKLFPTKLLTMHLLYCFCKKSAASELFIIVCLVKRTNLYFTEYGMIYFGCLIFMIDNSQGVLI